MAARSLRRRKMGVVLLDRGKPCRVDQPPQSGWQVAVSPLPTSPLTYIAQLHLSTCRSCSTFLEPNPKPPFHRPHSQLPLHISHLSHTYTLTLKMVVARWLSSLFLQAPHPPTPNQRARVLWGVWQKAPFRTGRGIRVPEALTPALANWQALGIG